MFTLKSIRDYMIYGENEMNVCGVSHMFERGKCFSFSFILCCCGYTFEVDIMGRYFQMKLTYTTRVRSKNSFTISLNEVHHMVRTGKHHVTPENYAAEKL